MKIWQDLETGKVSGIEDVNGNTLIQPDESKQPTIHPAPRRPPMSKDKVWTYRNQPYDNVDAWRLGEACTKAGNSYCDLIDRGLILLRELEAKGYGVVKLDKETPNE